MVRNRTSGVTGGAWKKQKTALRSPSLTQTRPRGARPSTGGGGPESSDGAGEGPGGGRHRGALAHILGQRSLARAAYERFLELETGDPEVTHILHALRDESPPARASDECIRHLYERFAPDYDRSMGDDLGFAAPRLLAEALEEHLGAPRAALDVLDMGCGTGLSGERLRPWARKLVGIDLSEDMLRLAATRGAHDELVRAELTGWLGQCSQRFELIVACDVLIYFGELAPILERAASLLCEGGMLAFTLELHDGASWALTDSGRYAHSAAHVRELARDADLHELRLDEVVLRQEYGAEVRGLRVVLAREQA